MTITLAEVISAITSNNTTRTVEILEKFGLTKTTPPFFTDDHKRLVSTMLSYASAMSNCNTLDSSLAEELIKRTAMTVDIFPFVDLVIAAARIKTDDGVIPENIRAALRENNYTDEIADAFEKLDNNTFRALLTYLMTEEVEQMDIRFKKPIIRRIHAEKIIPEHLMFAHMALCLRETIEEYLDDENIDDAISILDHLLLLDGLFATDD